MEESRALKDWIREEMLDPKEKEKDRVGEEERVSRREDLRIISELGLRKIQKRKLEKKRELQKQRKFGKRYSRDAFANWQNGGMKKDCIYVNRTSLF